MKIKTLATLAVALSFSATVVVAAPHAWNDPSGWWDNHFYTPRNPGPKFNAQELSLDLFASYTAAERGIENVFKTNIRETDNASTAWGGGVGLNYFFTREIGLGVDMNMPDNRGNLVDSVSGSLIVRLPWEAAGLAPYVFGGGGRETEPTWQWSVHAGVGLEYRFNPLTAIFADARYVWADDAYPSTPGYNSKYDGDHVLLRTGLRLVF